MYLADFLPFHGWSLALLTGTFTAGIALKAGDTTCSDGHEGHMLTVFP
jgi:hypothetical protein